MNTDYTLDKGIKRLEEIVISFENQGLSLKKILDLLEEGVKTSKICRMNLDEAEKKFTGLNLECLTKRPKMD